MTVKDADMYLNMPVRYAPTANEYGTVYKLDGILKNKKQSGEPRYSAILHSIGNHNSVMQVRIEDIYALE